MANSLSGGNSFEENYSQIVHIIKLHIGKWKLKAIPSISFDDIYFSAEDGIEESQYVYLEGSGFTQALKENKPHYTIGEVGFDMSLLMSTDGTFRCKSILSISGPESLD